MEASKLHGNVLSLLPLVQKKMKVGSQTLCILVSARFLSGRTC